ncbi:MAG: hypothetical protein FJX76_23385 [Armatimonadetes bacterium]|nr:hypothetical protein [Armatimonadota bacterium]
MASVAASVSRSHIHSSAQALRTGILRHHVIEPEMMHDPRLVHPYDMPPGSNEVLAENDEFMKVLDNYKQPTAGAIYGAAAEDARAHGLKSMAFGLGGALLALGAAGVGIFAPALAPVSTLITAGGFGALGIGLAVKENREAQRLEHFNSLLDGWARNIMDPSDLCAIPDSDGAVPFAYVQYVENRMISRRRSAAGVP